MGKAMKSFRPILAFVMAISLSITFAPSASAQEKNAVTQVKTGITGLNSPHTIKAAAKKASYKKSIRIKENKVMRINLNESKSVEKVFLKTRWIKSEREMLGSKYKKYELFINDKKKATRDTQGVGDWAFWEFYVADLNTKDKYKVILIQKCWRGPYYDIGVNLYKSKKLKKTSATFGVEKYDRFGDYQEVVSYRNSKLIPGGVSAKNIRIYKNGVFKVKIIAGRAGDDYDNLKYRWITLKMSKDGKIMLIE